MSTERLAKGYLQWRCRRGTKELDVMLTRFLDSSYETLSDQELHGFNELLNTQDTELWYWLSGQVKPNETAIQNIVLKIRDRN